MTPNIPNIELYVLVRDGFNIKSNLEGGKVSTRLLSDIVESKILHDNTPVGIVVTDWFNFSLYRMAGRYVSGTRERKPSTTYWSFLPHPGPTSTVSSPYFQRVSLLPRSAHSVAKACAGAELTQSLGKVGTHS